MLVFTRRGRRGLVAIASCLLLALAACSSGKNASGASITGPVPKADATLTVWSFMPSEYDKGAQAYRQVDAAFEKKYPQIKVDLVNLPYPTYFDKVRNATVARKGPDVVTMYGGAQAYSYRNGLVPLQDAMSPSLKSNLKFVADNYSRDGNLYILPTGTYGYSMLVNKAKFAAAGVDPKTALASWQGLLGACQKLSAAGIQPIASGWKDGYLFETFMYMMSSQLMDTATLAKWTQGKIPVDNTIFTTATDDIVAMNKAGCFGGEASLGQNMYDDSFNQYYSGKTAMMATGSLSTAQKAFSMQPSSTIMRLPQVPGSKYKDLIDAGAEAGWSVTKWTKSPQAAGAYVNFIASPQAQEIIWKTVGVPPNLKNLPVTGTTPMQKAYLPLMENPVNHTGFAAFPLTVLSVYERNAAPLMGGKLSVSEFTKQAQSAFEQTK